MYAGAIEQRGLEQIAFNSTQPAQLSWPATAGHPGDACSYFRRSNSEQRDRHRAEPSRVARWV